MHCQRITRETGDTSAMLIDLNDKGKDTMDVPLLNHDRILVQCRTNKGHVACIQDHLNIPLYKQTGTLKKGGEELPVYMCARKSTSLG